MPWCPKCETEYKEGYTVCADCGTELIDSLEEKQEEAQSEAEMEVQQAAEAMAAMSEEELEALQKEKEERIKALMRTPYEDADKKAEDYKSGADALLIVGVIGTIALVLLNLGVLPISLPAFTKAMITGVMGIMFVIFIFMGISSRKSYEKLKSQASSDKDTKADVIKYLKETINVEEFDKELCDDEPSMEILYFRRMEKLKEMVFAYAEGIDVSFTEYILEEVYPEIFE